MTTRRPLLLLVGALLGVAVVFSTTETLQIGTAATSHTNLATIPVSHGPQWTMRDEPPAPGIPKRPSMRCHSAIVVDNASGEILYTRDAYEVRPIASLTKLLTAMVFLESDVDLSGTATVTKEDAYKSSKSALRVGETLTLRDFLYAALVSSDNRAARILARSAGMDADTFIVRMNEKAKSLGMDSTHVIEPTGLSEQNVSNAYECAVLLDAALKNHLIRQVTTTAEVRLKPLNRKRAHRLVNTNRLLRYGYNFRGSKTGYINEAGWCIAASGVSPDGHNATVVVLGAPSNGYRFRSLRNALLWAYKFPLQEMASS